MAGMAVLRAGAGLSTVATAKSVLATVAGFHPELMTEPLEETAAGTHFACGALQHGRLDALAERKDRAGGWPGNFAPCLRPRSWCAGVVKKYKLPIVLDADGLNAFENRSAELKEQRGRLWSSPRIPARWRGLPARPFPPCSTTG